MLQRNISNTYTKLQEQLKSDRSSIIAVESLDLVYESVVLPAEVIHAQLKSDEKILREFIKEKLSKSQLDSSGDPKPNFLIVNISFLLSKPDKMGNTYISMPLKVDGYAYFSVRNSWYNDEGKDEDCVEVSAHTRSSRSAERIDKRHQCGLIHTPQIHNLSKVQKSGPLAYLDDDSATFSNKFHHSEQALFEHMIRHATIKQVGQQLKNYGVEENTTIKAIIIEANSTRYVCGNCELGFQGLTDPNYTFSKKLEHILSQFHINFVKETTPIIPRIVANKPCGNSKRQQSLKTNGNQLEYNVQLVEQNITPILQADNQHYQLHQVPTDFHRRSVFISSEVGSMTSYSTTLRELTIQEYVLMVAEGSAIYMNKDSSLTNLLKGNPHAFNALKETVFLNALDDANVEASAKQVYEQRKRFEGESIIEYNYRKFLSLGITHKQLTKLTDKKYEAICKDIVVCLLEEEKLSFEEFKLIEDENLIIFDLEVAMELVTEEDYTFDRVYQLYLAYDDKFVAMFDYDISEIIREHKLDLERLCELYDEDEIHLRCLGAEDLTDIFYELAPGVHPIVVQYYKDSMEADLEWVRSELTEYQRIDFNNNLGPYFEECEEEQDEEEAAPLLSL